LTAPPIVLATGWAVPGARLSPLHDHLALHLWSDPLSFDLAEVQSDPSQIPLPEDEPSAYAHALHDLLRVQHEPSLIIGWSTGALIALETACFWPEAVRSMVLISPTACFCAQDGYPYGPKPAALRAMISGVRSIRRKRVLREFFRQATLPGTLSSEESQELVGGALGQGESALLNGLTYLLHTDLRPRIPAVRQPTLILHGIDDHIIPVSAGKWVCDHLPDALSVWEPGRGHDIPLTMPDEISRHVRDFALS